MSDGRQALVGRRVRVRMFGRDSYGRRSDHLIIVSGFCDYIGPNLFLGYPLMITVNRMPIAIHSVDEVALDEK